MLAKKKVTISELPLTPVGETLPFADKHIPNEKTVEALKESRKGKLKNYKTLNEFWNAMGIDPNA